MEWILEKHFAGEALPVPYSRVEALLIAILNGTDYHGELMSQNEYILYAILKGQTYHGATIGRTSRILASIANGEPYTAAPLSHVEELLLRWKDEREHAE